MAARDPKPPSSLPGRVALITGLAFVLLALLPFAFVGEYWGMLWFYLVAPVSSFAESLIGIGSGSHSLIVVVTVMAAIPWALLAYWICSLIVKRKALSS